MFVCGTCPYGMMQHAYFVVIIGEYFIVIIEYFVVITGEYFVV